MVYSKNIASGLGGDSVSDIKANNKWGYAHSKYLRYTMTSTLAIDAKIPGPLAKDRYLRADKEGAPIDLQVPLTTQNTVAVTGGALVATGARYIPITTALVGVLTINMTNYASLIGREIVVFVRGGVGQNVVINFAAAGYTTYLNGAGAVTTHTLAANANAQKAIIAFTTQGAFIN